MRPAAAWVKRFSFGRLAAGAGPGDIEAAGRAGHKPVGRRRSCRSLGGGDLDEETARFFCAQVMPLMAVPVHDDSSATSTPVRAPQITSKLSQAGRDRRAPLGCY